MHKILYCAAFFAMSACSAGLQGTAGTTGAEKTSAAAALQDAAYFDRDAFRYAVNVMKVEAPYDTVKGLENVPADRIMFTQDTLVHTFLADRFSYLLSQAQEPILRHSDQKSSLYRFTWLRSFDQPVIIKLYHKAGRAVVETRWLQEEGTPGRTSVRKLPKGKMAEFEQLLDQVNFWTSPETLVEGLALDGSNWLLEGRTHAGYHFMSRYSPGKGNHPGLRAAGEWLIQNSDASRERIY